MSTESKGQSISFRSMFWWGVFALGVVIALFGLSKAPLASLGIYAVLQFVTITVEMVKADCLDDPGVLILILVAAVIGGLVVWGVSFIGLIWAIITALVLLMGPFFIPFEDM